MSRAFVLVALCALLAPTPASGNDPLAGAEFDYVLHCSACHGLDGRGVTGWTPSLHDLGALVASDAGRAYLVRVPGVAQAPLDDARLARLLDWVIERWSGTDAGFTGSEVATLRRRPLRDPASARPGAP